MYRYFCGPNARKTAAQAKQQRKRPRAGKKTAAANEDEEESGEGSEEEESEVPFLALGKAHLLFLVGVEGQNFCGNAEEGTAREIWNVASASGPKKGIA